ncbi:MAG: hypothetical protein M1826_002111 [Phylliscum demangeonii]|nr:MAG: hypothetical protein M1826_002111 [Phylliscum demangeonii]
MPEEKVQKLVEKYIQNCHDAYAKAVNVVADAVNRKEPATEKKPGTEPQQFSVIRNIEGAVAGRYHAMENAGAHLLHKSHLAHLAPAMKAGMFQLTHGAHGHAEPQKLPKLVELERAGV